MPVDRCPHCGSVLPTKTMPRAIEHRLSAGVATMEQLKKAARAIKPKATDKQIYNALAMLTRNNRVRHLGHGLYAPIAE